MSAVSDVVPIDTLADHGRRLSAVEGAIVEIRLEHRSLSDKLMQMHGENKASAEAREKATLQAIGAVRTDLQKIGSLRGWASWALIVTGAAFGYVTTHLAGWVQ
ncbi:MULTISPECIES: hypothetical protein [Asaia]|uniref:Transmembrane protein n=1 Tax=Asaia bogorensis TaxID=91915 RepID=A0A060QFH7_9PROT|nr:MULTISPECIES: hypothetical protein [Asaia]ETD00047.1 hypothetical protein P792_00225 [Asaia sp. SF2.1]CDG39655.1 hypothetical protein ASAP_1610 [Asaia bogorensis]